MADMANKLTLTSLLLFLPPTYQMPVGMVAITIYIISILTLRPYVRRGDDQLQLLALTEIFLLMLAGLVLQRNTGAAAAQLDPIVDILLSILLIATTICIMLGFLLMGIRYVRLMYYARLRQLHKELAVQAMMSPSSPSAAQQKYFGRADSDDSVGSGSEGVELTAKSDASSTGSPKAKGGKR